jgi:hypothetical protein
MCIGRDNVAFCCALFPGQHHRIDRSVLLDPTKSTIQGFRHIQILGCWPQLLDIWSLR